MYKVELDKYSNLEYRVQAVLSGGWGVGNSIARSPQIPHRDSRRRPRRGTIGRSHSPTPTVIERYTLPEMGNIWTETAKLKTWLQVEIAVCEAQAELGYIPAVA
ncbi:hypothetical protein QUB06_24040 [Microcoleus sp. D2_18a_D3]